MKEDRLYENFLTMLKERFPQHAVLTKTLTKLLMTARFGGSRTASVGATVGLLMGLFFIPLGLILGPCMGALVGESIHNRENSNVLKVAFGAALAFFVGTGFKLICSGFMAFYVIRAIVVWLF